MRRLIQVKGALTRDAHKKYGPLLIPLSVLFAAMWYDRTYVQKTYRTFHNKSALYGGRDLKPGEKSW